MQELLHDVCTDGTGAREEGDADEKKGGRRIRTAAGNRVSFVNQKDLFSRAPWI